MVKKDDKDGLGRATVAHLKYWQGNYGHEFNTPGDPSGRGNPFPRADEVAHPLPFRTLQPEGWPLADLASSHSAAEYAIDTPRGARGATN